MNKTDTLLQKLCIFSPIFYLSSTVRTRKMTDDNILIIHHYMNLLQCNSPFHSHIPIPMDPVAFLLQQRHWSPSNTPAERSGKSLATGKASMKQTTISGFVGVSLFRLLGARILSGDWKRRFHPRLAIWVPEFWMGWFSWSCCDWIP